MGVACHQCRRGLSPVWAWPVTSVGVACHQCGRGPPPAGVSHLRLQLVDPLKRVELQEAFVQQLFAHRLRAALQLVGHLRAHVHVVLVLGGERSQLRVALAQLVRLRARRRLSIFLRGKVATVSETALGCFTL